MAVNRIGQVKGALPAILRQSYIRRDRVAIVTFRGDEALLVLPPSRSISRALATLNSLPVGGATPLSLGLAKTLEIVKAKRQANGEEKTVLVFTDGRGNVSLRGSGQLGRNKREEIIGQELESIGLELRCAGARVIVVDTQPRHLSTGSAEFVADRLKADLARLTEDFVTEAGKIVKI
jgi:magnesium chelatase subunit D